MTDNRRHIILVTLDSCRYDSFVRAKTPFFDSLGTAEKARSHADQTLPSHYALLSGHLPDCSTWNTKIPFLAPWMPLTLKPYDYYSIGGVSLPWCHRSFGFARGFDDYYDSHSDMGNATARAPLQEILKFVNQAIHTTQPHFIFLNIGEPHFPYSLVGEEPQEWQDLLLPLLLKGEKPPMGTYGAMQAAQIKMVEWVDGELARFSRLIPDAAWIITADHGELFGEHGKFLHGHGCYPEEVEVPLVLSDPDWMRSLLKEE